MIPPGTPGDLLRLIRSGEATTRAELASSTGLARSTIAQRIDSLASHNLIVEAGEAVGVLAVTNDITEKRVLESQVADAREYLQSLIDNANDIIYTLDRTGRITFLNKMGQEVTGYGFNPSGQARYTDYIVKKDLSKNVERFQEALKGRPQRYATSLQAGLL